MGPGGPQSAALVISECQRGILDLTASVTPALAAQAAERGIVARIAGLAEAFRAAGLPVVHCHIAHRPDLAGIKANSLLRSLAIKNRTLIAGTPDTLPPPELAPHPGDHVSRRATGLTAFYGTDLDASLRLRAGETIVLTGVSTDVALPGPGLRGDPRARARGGEPRLLRADPGRLRGGHLGHVPRVHDERAAARHRANHR